MHRKFRLILKKKQFLAIFLKIFFLYLTGGALVVRHNDKQRTPCMYTIHGVVTQASCNSTKQTESIYTKLSPDYLRWIKCEVWDVGCMLKNKD